MQGCNYKFGKGDSLREFATLGAPDRRQPAIKSYKACGTQTVMVDATTLGALLDTRVKKPGSICGFVVTPPPPPPGQGDSTAWLSLKKHSLQNAIKHAI
jgi:hypothetical protein